MAGHLLREQPAAADEALGHVRAAARTVLQELATLLGVLRRDDEPESSTEPAPSLARLDALIDGFAAGQPVRWTIAGRPRPVPSAVDVAAYRIVQESLTNAHRHAPGAAVTVVLRYTTAGLIVEVGDDGGDGADVETPKTGFGLVGMRERAEAVGGTFAAGPGRAGGFLVRAELPAPDDPEETA